MHAQVARIYGKTVKFDVGTCAWFMFFNGAVPTEMQLTIINDRNNNNNNNNNNNGLMIVYPQGGSSSIIYIYLLYIYISINLCNCAKERTKK